MGTGPRRSEGGGRYEGGDDARGRERSEDYLPTSHPDGQNQDRGTLCLRLQRGCVVRGRASDDLGTGRRRGGARARGASMSTIFLLEGVHVAYGLDTLTQRLRQWTGRTRLAWRAVTSFAIVLVLGIAIGASAQETSKERERERLLRCAAPIGCVPFSYAVSLTWAAGWRPGPYELTISIDGMTRHCTVAAPDAVCGDPTTAVERHRQAKQCDLGPAGYVALIDAVRLPTDRPPRPLAIPTPEQDQFEQQLYQLAGCALSGRHAPLGIITFRTRLNYVKVSVSTGGRVVGPGDYRPIYEMRKPLGRDCDFVCPGAKGDTLIINP